jgi:hypothetical protein
MSAAGPGDGSAFGSGSGSTDAGPVSGGAASGIREGAGG